MKPLAATVRQTIARHSMVAPGMRVLVAVSGGPDSLALLHVLLGLQGELGINLVAAHFDHGFRKDSASEVEFVRRVAEEWAVPFMAGAADVPRMLRGARGPQDAARSARYAFLTRSADTVGAARIAVGHTADDQAETLLLHLVRGAGAGGLAGMAAVRGRLIRPLIEAWRVEVERHCQAHGLKPLRDPSNSDRRYLRNRIRSELFPQLASYNPRIGERLVATAQILADEHRLIDALARRARQRMVSEGGIDREAFLALHPAIQRALLRQLAPEIDASQVEAARRAMQAASGRTFHISRGLRLTTSYQMVSLAPDPPSIAFEAELDVPGEVTVPPLDLRIRARECTCADVGPHIAHLDRDALVLPLRVAPRRRGERFQPLGMAVPKRLQDFLVDRKVPRIERDRLPLVRDGSRIAWIPGVSIAEWARVVPQTKRILHLEIERLQNRVHDRD